MKCHYINLDAATARRANLEAAFKAVNPVGWELVRIAASGPTDAADLPGTASVTEKACWLSHQRAIEASLADDDHIAIIEDDVVFSPRTFPILRALAEADPEWDLLYTDVTLTEVSTMVSFARDWPQLARAGNFRLHDLAKVPFIGAAGYVVRAGSKRRVLDALASLPPFDRAYDVALRDLIRTGVLQGRACFPYLTAPSDDAEASTIQPSKFQFRDSVVNAFRRLMFVDRDLDASRRDVARLEAAHGDAAATVLGGVFAGLVSDRMPMG